MLYFETVNPATLELLIKLMKDSLLQDFVLVGGTSLALQIGHRISIDLDLFSNKAFEENDLAMHLLVNYQFELDFIAKRTIKGEINGIQIDCIAHQYPWIEKPIIVKNIRFASLMDIAAMKLNAIAGNGTRVKDFIDVAFLSEKLSFNNMLEAYTKKYNSNPIIPVKSLTYFEEINFDEPLKMIKGETFNWKIIENRLKELQKSPDQIFTAL
jgi:hypothetical protein